MKKRNKNNCIVFIMLLLLCIGIGYAVLNSTLIITGKSSISKNIWDVHFENVHITTGSVEAIKVPTIENSTSADFEVNLNLPGDFYEFYVDVRNSGTIDAMIDSVVKTPDLTEEQKKYINYIVSYQNGEEITAKQLVSSNEFLRLKVRVEYKKDLTVNDLPSETEILILGLDFNFIQADNSGFLVKNNGVIIVPTAKGSLDLIGTIVTIGSEQFYTIGTEGDNVKLLSMYNLYVGNEVTGLSVDDDGNETFMMNALSNPTGMQSSNAKGLIAEVIDNETQELQYSFPWVGATAFSSVEQHGKRYNNYEGSIVEGYVNSYKELLESKFDVEIESARLLLAEDTTNFETYCSDVADVESCIMNRLSWISSTSYWLGTPVGSSTYLFGIYSYGSSTFADHSDDSSFGVRPVILMKKSDIVVDSKPFAYGDINKIGTIVTIGTEQFYTIGTEGDTVKLLSKYNLYVGNSVDEDYNVNPLSNPTGKQSELAKGYTEEFPYIGTTAFSNTGTEYSGSIVEGYVNNYKHLLESNFGVEVIDARLITVDELTNSETFACGEDEDCIFSDKYQWIYSTTYWSGSAIDANHVLSVNSHGEFDNDDYDFGDEAGVRPVIVISKDYF